MMHRIEPTPLVACLMLYSGHVQAAFEQSNVARRKRRVGRHNLDKANAALGYTESYSVWLMNTLNLGISFEKDIVKTVSTGGVGFRAGIEENSQIISIYEHSKWSPVTSEKVLDQLKDKYGVWVQFRCDAIDPERDTIHGKIRASHEYTRLAEQTDWSAEKICNELRDFRLSNAEIEYARITVGKVFQKKAQYHKKRPVMPNIRIEYLQETMLKKVPFTAYRMGREPSSQTAEPEPISLRTEPEPISPRTEPEPTSPVVKSLADLSPGRRLTKMLGTLSEQDRKDRLIEILDTADDDHKQHDSGDVIPDVQGESRELDDSDDF